MVATEDTLRECLSVREERGKSYGTVRENFGRIREILRTLYDVDLREDIIAKVMVATKFSREKESHKHDNIVDVINYLAINEELMGCLDDDDSTTESTNAVAQPVIYVAGPFRADNAWDIEQNIRAAEELALDAWEMGYAVICPHANTRYFQGALPDHVWLDGDLEIVRRCDGVLVTDNWTRSAGARSEVREALACGKRVYHLCHLPHASKWNSPDHDWSDSRITIEDQLKACESTR